MLLKNIKEFFKSLMELLRLPEMSILPGNLAFFLILSLAPIVSLFGIIASLFSLEINELSVFNDIFPSSVIEMLNSFLNGNVGTVSIVFIILGLYAASKGSDNLIIASNVLYKARKEKYLKRKLKAIFMTFWLLILFIVVLILLAFGNFILNKLLFIEFFNKLISNNYIIITTVKLLIAFLVIFITIKIIYTLAPNFKIKSKYVNRGALFATMGIMLVSEVYSYYVTNFAHYDMIYGSLSNIIILMFLIYFISYILVLGIAINNNYYQLDDV